MADYNRALVVPLWGIQTFSSDYATDESMCRSRQEVDPAFWCAQAKGDAVEIRGDEERALSVYEQMESDPLLNDQDRGNARQSVEKLQAALGAGK